MKILKKVNNEICKNPKCNNILDNNSRSKYCKECKLRLSIIRQNQYKEEYRDITKDNTIIKFVATGGKGICISTKDLHTLRYRKIDNTKEEILNYLDNLEKDFRKELKSIRGRLRCV